MIKSTVGMYGDLQGIAGKALEEIDGLAQIARRVEARRKRGPETTEGKPSVFAAALIDAACINQREAPRARLNPRAQRSRGGPFC